MKTLLIIIAVTLSAAAFACDVQSGITKKSVEEFQPTPTPSVSPTPAEVPIDPADVVEVNTSVQGDQISINEAKSKKDVNCDKYNQVMVNISDAVVTVKGACSQIMINGSGNDVTAEAVMSVVFNGSRNKFKYSRFGNAKRPNVTNNKSENTVEKVAAATPKK